MKLLYLMLVILALIAFVKMSLYLGFLTVGILLGIFLYKNLSKKLSERRESLKNN